MADGRLIFDTEIDSSGFESDLKGLEVSTNGLSNSFAKGFLKAGIIKSIAQEVFGLGKDSVEAASNLQEMRNVIDTTFGNNADAIYEFGAAAKETYGMANTLALRYAGQFGTLFKTAGVADEEVLQYTKDLVGLAADLASFWDIGFEESLYKINSALKGETEAINDLGIDVRIAALSEFMGYSMEGASQLEQLTAIYGKLMADTEAVQGDFIKTQDSFSNQMRILETNISEIEALVGDRLLPVANAVVSAMNDLFSGFAGEQNVENPTLDRLETVVEQWTAFSDAMKASGEQFQQSQEKIAVVAELAEGYLSTLEALESKEVKTDEDIRAIENAVTALNNLYPQLELYFDPATGKINENTQAIRDNIQAMQTLAVQELFSQQQQANTQAYAQAISGLADANLALEEAEAPLNALQKQVDGINGLLKQLDENGFQGIDAYFGQYAELINGFDQYFEQLPDGSWTAIEGIMPDPGQITNATQNALTTLNIQREQLLQGVEQAQAAVDSYNASITAIFMEQAKIEEKQAKVLELMNGSGQQAAEEFAAGASASASEAADAVQILVNAAANNADVKAYVTAGARAAKAYVAGLKSVSIPVISARFSAGSFNADGKHATGLDRVPYDNYLARLHAGEAVLTAAEARQWRSGKSGADASTIAAGISAAMAASESKRPVVINVNGKTVAKIMAADNARAANEYSRSAALGVGKR